ncbi:structural molecules protein [Perilla frutescens var. hirtella]|nr:structural molecules protein [Perilla frutescens var. frutescens]KAH6801566.1 structural molecules protein [Perilla frutescens var. hirtella]
MFYGAAAWDPWLIVAQIVCLQCLYYLNLGLFLAILVGPRVSKMSLVYLFDFATVTASTATGWCVIASIFLSSVAGAGVLVYLVERAKKCLDFSATVYIIHLFICLLYGGWPSSITWWVVNITGLAVMALLGEYLCMKRELRDIPIGRYRSTWQNFEFLHGTRAIQLLFRPRNHGLASSLILLMSDTRRDEKILRCDAAASWPAAVRLIHQ